MEKITLDNRNYIIYPCENPEKVLLLIIDKKDEKFADMLYSTTKTLSNKCMLTACLTDNWNSELSPWEAPAVFGTEPFKGEANLTLKALTTVFIPYLIKTYALNTDKTAFYTVGYSLAGLFSLWSIYNTNLLSGALCCSASLWFPNFEDYIKTHTPQSAHTIYLSLGDKEHKTKNPLMSTVKSVTQRIYEYYQTIPEIKTLKLEWNNGNHFNHPDERIKKSILWLLEYGA